MKNELIDRILPLEYAMFQQVPNRNGRAACQDNWATFRIMRSSQFSAWTPEMCRLYLTCLQAAWSQGRNLVQEKYGWMMADTFPEEFAALQSALPPVEPERQRLVSEILDIQLPMTACLQQRCPLATRRAGPYIPTPRIPERPLWPPTCGASCIPTPCSCCRLILPFAAAASPAAQSAPGDPGIHGPPIWVRRSGCI